MSDLSGQVIVVTGGASGLGLALCQVLGDAGATIIVADMQAEKAEAVASEIGGQAVAIDLRDADACTRLIDAVAVQHGRIDALINNAGTDKTESIADLNVEDFDRVLSVNLRAPFVLSKAALAQMSKAGRGMIVNIVSTAAKRAWANASAYHASKWGLLGFSHALHVEGRAEGVKVTALIAGGMRTPFILDRFPDVPLENLQDPRAVAETVRFLLTQPGDVVIPELMIVPMRETSWP